MKRLWAPFLIAFLLLVPALASAQSNLPLFDPEWQLVPEAHELDPDCPVGAPLGFAGFLQLIQNGMNAAISFGIVIFVLIIAFAGMLWILTPTNPENHSQAKKVLTNAVIGLLIILSAWLIVDFVMKLLYNDNGGFGPWNEIITGGDYCVVAASSTPLFSGTIVGTPMQLPGGGRAGGGQCSVPVIDNHPCSLASLRGTRFEALGEHASRVCNKESGGRSVPSGSDKLNSGRGPSYSWGLWQINLTTTDTEAAGWGMDCRAAFSGPCSGDAIRNQGRVGWCSQRVTNQELFDRCTAAALNPAKNTRAAQNLYTSNLSAWACSAQRCGVPNARRVDHPSCQFGR
ncbi:MAG TPA: pilin [Candidatus Paceibacterota bacterium]